MPKPMYVWSGSAWVSVASEVESLAGFATQSYADNTPGTRLIVPTSVTVGSGSGSVATQGTVSFSGASSVSVNGCFNSTYTAYKIILTTQAATTQGDLKLRMRASGTDTTGSVYSYNLVFTETSSRTTYNYIASSGNTTSATIGVVSANQEGMTIFDIYNPFATKNTGWLSRTNNLGATDTMFTTGGGRVNDTLSYNSISIFNSAGGNISGTIQVYGYKA